MNEPNVSVALNDPNDGSSFNYSTFVKLENAWNDWEMESLFSFLCKGTFKASGGDRALNIGLKHVISQGFNAFSERAEHTLASDHKVSLIKEQYSKIVCLKFVLASENPQVAPESVNVATSVPRQRSSSNINPMFLTGYAKFHLF